MLVAGMYEAKNVNTCPQCNSVLPEGADACTSSNCTFQLGIPNRRGEEFEDTVLRVMGKIANHPRVAIETQPRVKLQNGETLVPDFNLAIVFLHEIRTYFIECQDREQYSKAILHKIQHLRNKQWRKSVLFVSRSEIPSELGRALATEGVTHKTLIEFVEFIDRLNDQLALHGDKSDKSDGRPQTLAAVSQRHDRDDFSATHQQFSAPYKPPQRTNPTSLRSEPPQASRSPSKTSSRGIDVDVGCVLWILVPLVLAVFWLLLRFEIL